MGQTSSFFRKTGHAVKKVENIYTFICHFGQEKIGPRVNIAALIRRYYL
jgi:hypothetical protein